MYWLFVAFCFAQFAGRLGASIVVAGLTRLLPIPSLAAPLTLTLSGLMAAVVSAAAFTYNSMSTFWVYSIISAYVYGSLWFLIFPLSMPDLYVRGDARNLSFYYIYGLLSLSPAFGPFAFNLLSGLLYDQHADPTSHLCTGAVCYHLYFGIATVCLIVALLLCAATLLYLAKRPQDEPSEVLVIASSNTSYTTIENEEGV